MGENKETNWDDIRKSLFVGDKGERNLKEKKGMHSSQKNDDEAIEEKVFDLLSHLKKVNLKVKEYEKQTHNHQDLDRIDPRKDNTIGINYCYYIIKQNILNPTTKTFTPIPPQTNNAPTPKQANTPSERLPERS